jgi:hypothetical protein
MIKTRGCPEGVSPWLRDEGKVLSDESFAKNAQTRRPGPGWLAGVDVEAQDGVYFYRLVAAKYGAEFPVG